MGRPFCPDDHAVALQFNPAQSPQDRLAQQVGGKPAHDHGIDAVKLLSGNFHLVQHHRRTISDPRCGAHIGLELFFCGKDAQAFRLSFGQGDKIGAGIDQEFDFAATVDPSADPELAGRIAAQAECVVFAFVHCRGLGSAARH